jgi:hypothetical protein
VPPGQEACPEQEAGLWPLPLAGLSCSRWPDPSWCALDRPALGPRGGCLDPVTGRPGTDSTMRRRPRAPAGPAPGPPGRQARYDPGRGTPGSGVLGDALRCVVVSAPAGRGGSGPAPGTAGLVPAVDTSPGQRADPGRCVPGHVGVAPRSPSSPIVVEES